MLKQLLFTLLFITVALFYVPGLQAQNDGASKNSSGSFYSLFGVGYPTDNNTAREYGLGITGVSLDNTQSNTLQNPALWGKNALTTASSGFSLSQYQAKDSFSKSTNSILEAGHFQFSFPVLREKLGFSVALYSVTRSNYRYFEIDSVATPNDEFISYISDSRGNGGINKLEVGVGWNINKNIAVGYAPSFAFISQNSTDEVFFNEAEYGVSNLNNSITGGTFSQRFGALANFRRLLSNKDRLSIGGAVNLPFRINAEQQTTTTKQVDGITQEVQIKDGQGTVKFPVEINAGLTYYPSSLVNISFEGQYQQWSEFESDFRTNDASIMMTDRQKLGLGVEYHPYKTSSSSFLSNFRYSLGSSFDSGHLSIENNDISTLWVSAGLGIISSRSRSTVDLGIRYGLRGTTSNNLISEKIWSFNLSVNLSELMFFRPKLN